MAGFPEDGWRTPRGELYEAQGQWRDSQRYTEPADVQGSRHLSSGTFALQAHDPGSRIDYRNGYVRPLGMITFRSTSQKNPADELVNVLVLAKLCDEEPPAGWPARTTMMLENGSVV